MAADISLLKEKKSQSLDIPLLHSHNYIFLSGSGTLAHIDASFLIISSLITSSSSTGD